MLQEVIKQVPKITVQEVVKTMPAPMPAPTYAAPAPIVETFAPTYAAPMPMTTMAAPMPTYGAPLVGSISAALPMTTMAAPMPMATTGFGTTSYPAVGTSYGLPPTIL